MSNKTIAVLIPCHNEELTVGDVVRGFQKALPSAKIYVFDNNCTDRTAEIAEKLGATVIREKKKGKGWVVRSMFEKVEADYYLMVDGDSTYPPEEALKLLDPVMKDRADMTVGNRLIVYDKKAFRPLHVMGNNLVKNLVNKLFNVQLKDIMSGYRGMSRELVHGIMVQSEGFEVETEMTLKCLNNGFVIQEVDIPYKERPKGSHSKLKTFSDGFRVLKAIFIIFRDYKPLQFFAFASGFLFLVGLASGGVVVAEFLETHYITHVPLAVLAVGCVLSGLVLAGIGLILDSMKNRFNEIYSYVRSKTLK